MPDIEQPIIEYVTSLGEGTAGAIGPDSQLLESGLLDSINLVQLIQFVEERFGVAIPDEDIGPEIFATPATLSAYVTKKLG
jgi:acyl carrier protein